MTSKTARLQARHRPLRRQQAQGFALPVLAIAIAVAALMTYGFTQRQLNVAQQNAGAAAGYALNQVALAVDNYRGVNLSALTVATPVVSGFVSPMLPTVAELKTAGFLNPAVLAALPDGNSYSIQINKQPAGCVGPSTLCNVYSILSLVNPILDTNGNPSITRLGALTAAVQDPVGYSALPTLGTITGGNGAWSISNPDASQRAGIVAVVAGLGGSGSQWLRVGDPRDPAFTGNASTAGYLKPSNGAGMTVTAGTACIDPTGAIKNDAAGRVLSCQAGVWTSGDGAKSITLRAPIGNVPGGNSYAVDVCPTGGTPWATYAAQISAVNLAVNPAYTVLTYSLSQVGSNWVTLTQAVTPPSTAVTVNSNASVVGIIPMGVFSSGCSF